MGWNGIGIFQDLVPCGCQVLPSSVFHAFTIQDVTVRPHLRVSWWQTWPTARLFVRFQLKQWTGSAPSIKIGNDIKIVMWSADTVHVDGRRARSSLALFVLVLDRTGPLCRLDSREQNGKTRCRCKCHGRQVGCCKASLPVVYRTLVKQKPRVNNRIEGRSCCTSPTVMK